MDLVTVDLTNLETKNKIMDEEFKITAVNIL